MCDDLCIDDVTLALLAGFVQSLIKEGKGGLKPAQTQTVWIIRNSSDTLELTVPVSPWLWLFWGPGGWTERWCTGSLWSGSQPPPSSKGGTPHLNAAKWRETWINSWSLQGRTFMGERSAVEAPETLTWESPLFHEVTHELRLCEEDVIELVHTELVDLIDVLPAIQILMEGLYFTCTSQRHTDNTLNKRADFPLHYVFMFILFGAVTLVVCFRGVAELSGDVFVVVEVQRGWGDRTTRPAGIIALLFHHQWQSEQLAVW